MPTPASLRTQLACPNRSPSECLPPSSAKCCNLKSQESVADPQGLCGVCHHTVSPVCYKASKASLVSLVESASFRTGRALHFCTAEKEIIHGAPWHHPEHGRT